MSNIAVYILNSVGLVMILISVFGYISNTLNWKFLNYSLTHILYDLGASIHETSHALLCIVTGAKIEKFRILTRQPQVTYREPRLPLIGNALISFAPIAGGLLFLYFVNRYLLTGYFVIPTIHGWSELLSGTWKILSQVNLRFWQSWAMILFVINAGAMIGPSYKDLKNIWLIIIVLLFVHNSLLSSLCFLALALIVVNIIIQVILIVLSRLLSLFA